eukprot:5239137-Pleurochrysis_carterae.AAC.4
MPIARGLRLFEELFRRLQRAAVRRRTCRGAPPLDIGELVRVITSEELMLAKQSDMMMRAAVEASRADAAAREARGHNRQHQPDSRWGGTPSPSLPSNMRTPLTGARQNGAGG